MVMPSILIPLDLTRRTDLAGRALRLASVAGEAGFNLVIAHADRSSVHDRQFKAKLAQYDDVRIVSVEAGNVTPNLARLRNEGMRAIDDDIVLLLDADIDPDANLFHALVGQVKAGAPLAMAPCLYLSKQGTRALHLGKSKSEIIASSLAFAPDFALHWAIPSSVMALRRSDYLAVGGFCEGYEGHGYEDLDFMLRLALATGLAAPSASLLIDRPYRAPLLAEGFRGRLGTLCLANLLDGQIALHLFHERDDAEPYYRRRQDNAKLFHDHVKALVCNPPEGERSDAIPPMIEAFYTECLRRGVNPANYHALFDARPRHMLCRRPLYSRLWRDLRRSWQRAS